MSYIDAHTFISARTHAPAHTRQLAVMAIGAAHPNGAKEGRGTIAMGGEGNGRQGTRAHPRRGKRAHARRVDDGGRRMTRSAAR